MRGIVPFIIRIDRERDRKNSQMAELSKSVALNRNAMNYLWIRMHSQVYLSQV